jgi:hypothetical protein
MKYIFVSIFILICFFTSELIGIDNTNNLVAHERVKKSLDRATHDASFQIMNASLNTGNIKFDQAKVLTVLRQSLSKNLYLNESDLSPIGGSANLLKYPIVIKYCVGVDSGTFPQTVFTGLPNVPSVLVLKPSVVAVVEFRLPSRTLITTQFTSTVGSTYEYK